MCPGLPRARHAPEEGATVCTSPTWGARSWRPFKCQLCSWEKKVPHREGFRSAEEILGKSDEQEEGWRGPEVAHCFLSLQDFSHLGLTPQLQTLEDRTQSLTNGRRATNVHCFLSSQFLKVDTVQGGWGLAAKTC